MTGDEHKQLREGIGELQNETRQYLADELGGELDDYRNDSES
jgi:hypothetical protein